jgi:hypothetical protein
VETEQTGTKKKEERDELRLHLGWARVGFIRIKSMRGPGEKRFIGKHLIIIICFEICAILKKRGVLKQFSKKNTLIYMLHSGQCIGLVFVTYSKRRATYHF